MDLAQRIKAARSTKGLSLRALGDLTGFSASFLSQVELGQASPSLSSLGKIAKALSVGLTDLLAEPASASPGPILRRRNEETVRSEWSRAVVQSLLPAGASAQIGAVLVTLEPGGRSGKVPEPQTGQELAFCVRGKVSLTVDAKAFELSEGDSLFYDARRPLLWENAGKRRAELLLIMLPGT